MFSNFFSLIANLFSDCSKYQDDPSYEKIIDTQYTEYYSNNKITYDPLWQDRRILTFLTYKKKSKDSI